MKKYETKAIFRLKDSQDSSSCSIVSWKLFKQIKAGISLGTVCGKST